MDINTKFENILDSLLHSKYKTTNDVYMEMLLSHLSGKFGIDHTALLKSPFVLGWLEKCLQLLEVDSKRLRPEVLSFMLKFTAVLLENEWMLVPMRESRIIVRLGEYLEANQNTFQPIVKLGHIQFLASVNKYSLGLDWIKQSGAWRSLVTYCQQHQTQYVVRGAVKLLYDILNNFSFNMDDEEQCVEMLSEIMKPLTESVYKEDAVQVYVDDIEIQQKLMPTLHLIAFILYKTLESEKKSNISFYLEKNFKLTLNLWKLASMTQNEAFMWRIFATCTCLNYAQLVYEKWTSGCIPSEEFNQFGVNFFNSMKFLISKKSCHNVLKLAELNHKLWVRLGNRAPDEIVIENERIKFENQLIVYHLLPVLFVFRHHIRQEEELFDNYMMKLFSITCELTLRACYSFRDLFYECIEKIPDFAYKSIHGILAMEKVLHQDRAVLVFQTIAYALKEFAIDGHCPERNNPKADTDLLVKMPNLLSAVLVGCHMLIHRYNISWKESLESTYLLHFTMALLNNPNLTPMLTVQSLKLTQTCIEHFLSPNLALLVDNLQGSALQHLGPMLLKRLHDNSWEVRDSTLELITSMTSISRLKFPAFQQYILENGICPVIWSIAKHDEEPYCRASALKCLNEMTQINFLWENSLNQFEMIDHLLKVSCVEPEAIARQEAVLLVTRIYCKRKVAANYLDLIYSTLAYSSVSDLHWEVKLNSLIFWKSMICVGFENQGMIDGTFPSVTFSKEKKKIITLTQNEILLRIEKVLLEASEKGCLGVLLQCLNDNCDFAVTKRAVVVIKKLLSHIQQYDFMNYYLERNANVAAPMETDSEILTANASNLQNSQSTQSNSDDIIESIINAQDINLLSDTYAKQMQLNDSAESAMQIDPMLYKEYAKVGPVDFMRKLKTFDLCALIKEKNDWISNTESLESLLDDISYSIQTLNVNEADCY